MIEWIPGNLSCAARFFNENTPNFPIVMSVFEGHNPGKIWVDSVNNPSVCLVITAAGYSFVGKTKEIQQAMCLDIILLLKTHGSMIKLVWAEPADEALQLFKQAEFVCVERIQFHYPALLRGDVSLIDASCNKLASGYHIKKIDETLLKSSRWLSNIKSFYGSEENFLKKGFGLALLHHHELVSEAFAIFMGGNFVETGSVTAEEYRGKGFATIVRAFLMKEILSRHLFPATSCNVDNPASANVSKKLGFEEKIRYQFLVSDVKITSDQ